MKRGAVAPERKQRLRIPFRSRRGEAATEPEEISLIGQTDLPGIGEQRSGIPERVDDVVQREDSAQSQSDRVDQETICIWLFQPDHPPSRVSLDRVPELVADDANFVWIDCSEYTEDEVRTIAALLRLHPGIPEAVIEPWRRPSLVVYGDHFLATATVARLDPEAYRVHAGRLDLIAGNNVLISAHKLPLPFGERILARARHNPELLRLDSAFMLYIVFDELLAYYDELNRHIQSEIEHLEERALRDTSDEFLEALLYFKRYAFAVAHLVDQHREIFRAFLRPDFRWVAGTDVEMYFRDLSTRLAQLHDSLLLARDAVNGAFDIHVSHMTHRTNQVIKLLTMVSTVLLPATVVIALFGTNLAQSTQGTAIRTPTGFVVMLLVIVVISGGTLLWFRRRGWI